VALVLEQETEGAASFDVKEEVTNTVALGLEQSKGETVVCGVEQETVNAAAVARSRRETEERSRMQSQCARSAGGRRILVSGFLLPLPLLSSSFFSLHPPDPNNHLWGDRSLRTFRSTEET